MLRGVINQRSTLHPIVWGNSNSSWWTLIKHLMWFDREIMWNTLWNYMNSTFWLAAINPTKTLGVHLVRSIPGLCLTKGPRTAVLPAAESAVQSAGHVASRRGSACGRRNRGRRAWRGCGRGHVVQKPCGVGCPGSQHDIQSSTINWPGMAQVV